MNPALQLRHALHAHPDLSGDEQATAARICDFFSTLSPDQVIRGLGGCGVAFVFDSGLPGKTVMLRCELDALPVQEAVSLPWSSAKSGVSHKCGHDGHMAILAAVGQQLAINRPGRGRVVLLFQPAEETGAGARLVIADPGFDDIRPDLVFGLHNIPGAPEGQVVVRVGTFTCASRGMVVRLNGKPAHAAQPETGISPARSLVRIIDACSDLPAHLASAGELVLATVVGATMGGPNFGMAPGSAEVFITLRTETDTTMRELVGYCEERVRNEAASAGLQFEVAYQDVFDATVNGARAVGIIRRACGDSSVTEAREPFRWSEDFGRYTQLAEGAFFGLGAGEVVPDLHNEDYDFPDALIARGAEVFLNILNECLGAENDE